MRGVVQPDGRLRYSLDIYMCWGVSEWCRIVSAYLNAICVWRRWRGQTFASVNEDIDSVGGGGSVLDTGMMDQSPPGGSRDVTNHCGQQHFSSILSHIPGEMRRE